MIFSTIKKRIHKKENCEILVKFIDIFTFYTYNLVNLNKFYLGSLLKGGIYMYQEWLKKYEDIKNSKTTSNTENKKQSNG